MIVALLLLCARPLLAQCSTEPVAHRTALVVVGGAADDSLRLGSLLGWCGKNSSLIRSAMTLRAAPADAALRFVPLDPVVNTAWNSDLPNSRNDGVMWAGRGLSYAVSAGFAASYRHFDVAFAPILTRSENRLFDVIASSGNPGSFRITPTADPKVSPFASPWHSGIYAADYPLRFGNQSFHRFDAGESWARVRAWWVSAGVSNATQWWGPGVENALMMSNNAGGIPHLFLRSAEPMRTPAGEVEWALMSGVLTESPFFDKAPSNDRRSLSAAVVTLRLAADTGLTIGVERGVYQTLAGLARLPYHFGDVFLNWHSGIAETNELTGAFARWAFPGSGLAAYGEWMRLTLPLSLRDWLVSPGNGQGYTIGLEWGRSLSNATVGIQAEATNLEQTPGAIGVEWPDFYTSRDVRQGYTQRGQIIGAAIGPGASSQSAKFTFLRGAMGLEASLARIRWEDGAYYRSPGGFNSRTHDVSLEAGVQARFDSRHAQVEIGYVRSLRKNYLFQSPNPYLFESAFDHRNTMLTTRISPHF